MRNKQILVIGAGGREHALAWRLAQSPNVSRVYVAPGNAGTAQELKLENVPYAADDSAGLIDFARTQAVDFTVVGPEGPLAAGIVDAFASAGLRCLGPSQAAARLESSKAFAKDFFSRHHIPTAAYRHFDNLGEARHYIRTHGAPLVIKADGLAAGKGVTVAFTEDEALQAAERLLENHAFGAAGQRIVIEDYLQGEEVSFIVLCDGESVLPLATAQDHKARDDGDNGPNTGGMGAYSPAPIVTQELNARIMNEVILPTVRGMAAEGHAYKGFLFAGLMITTAGDIKVLEFNCRLGDPETQVILLRLQSDFAELCAAALNGKLHEVQARWDERTALGVVLAAAGYPETYRKDSVISGLPDRDPPDTKIFHSGTLRRNGQWITAGGRVLCVCALGDTVKAAQTRAYEWAHAIHWEGMFHRSDIGYRALRREMT